jgi:hypothetical protein
MKCKQLLTVLFLMALLLGSLVAPNIVSAQNQDGCWTTNGKAWYPVGTTVPSGSYCLGGNLWSLNGKQFWGGSPAPAAHVVQPAAPAIDAVGTLQAQNATLQQQVTDLTNQNLTLQQQVQALQPTPTVVGAAGGLPPGASSVSSPSLLPERLANNTWAAGFIALIIVGLMMAGIYLVFRRWNRNQQPRPRRDGDATDTLLIPDDAQPVIMDNTVPIPAMDVTTVLTGNGATD